MSVVSEFELQRIAGAMSGLHGVFPSDALVNYGQTVIVKPGSTTEEGRVLTGADVQRMLGGDYQVFPLAVEYAPSLDAIFGAAEETEEDIDDLDSELDSMPDPDDEVGRVGVRRSAKLEKKYLKALARFSRCQTLLQAGKGKSTFFHKVMMPFTFFLSAGFGKKHRVMRRAEKCDDLYQRLIKVRAKMEKKGIDVSRLPRPEAFLADVANRWTRRHQTVTHRRPPAYPGHRPGGYVPVSSQAAYHRDQRELENDMASVMPRYGADDEVGVEEIINEEIELRMGDEGERALADDLRAETIGFLHSRLEHDYFGLKGSTLEDDWDPKGLVEAQILLRDPLDQVLDEEIIEGDDSDLIQSVLAADDEAVGVDLESDGTSHSSDTFGEDEDLGVDDGDIVASVLGAADDDLLDAGGDDSSDDDDDDDDKGPLEELTEEAKTRLSAFRSRLYRALGESMGDGEDADTIGAIAKKIDATTKKLQPQDRSAKVDYRKIQPRQPGEATRPPVIVIAIQKRESTPGFQSEIRGAVEAMGGVVGFDGEVGLIDTFGAGLFRVKHGYSPAESVKALRDTMRPSEWVRGSMAPFPQGTDAPLPPPRRTGPEVTG